MRNFIITYRLAGVTHYDDASGVTLAHAGLAFLSAHPLAELLHIQSL